MDKKNSSLYHLLTNHLRKEFDKEKLQLNNSDKPLTDDQIKYILDKSHLTRTQAEKIIKDKDPNDPNYQNLMGIFSEMIRQPNSSEKVDPQQEVINRSVLYDGMIFTLGQKQRYGVPESLDHLAENVAAMHKTAEENGTNLFALTYGSSWGWYQEVNTVLIQGATAGKYRLINTSNSLFSACHGAVPCDEYFFADYHANAKGYEIIAHDLDKYLSSESAFK